MVAPAGRRAAAAQAAAVVRAADPLLAQLLDVRVVTTRRAGGLTNHVNLRVAAPFATMLHHERTPSHVMIRCLLMSRLMSRSKTIYSYS